MTTPWNIMDQLQNWASLLQDHIDKLKLTSEQVKQFQSASWHRWQKYTEPGDEMETSASSPTKRHSRTVMDTGEDLEPLPEGTLARNLGLDLIVVINKTDFMADLEKDYDYKEEHFDFIQQAVSYSKNMGINFIINCPRFESFVFSTEQVYSIPASKKIKTVTCSTSI